MHGAHMHRACTRSRACSYRGVPADVRNPKNGIIYTNGHALLFIVGDYPTAFHPTDLCNIHLVRRQENVSPIYRGAWSFYVVGCLIRMVLESSMTSSRRCFEYDRQSKKELRQCKAKSYLSMERDSSLPSYNLRKRKKRSIHVK
jgi:hypothetical protein